MNSNKNLGMWDIPAGECFCITIYSGEKKTYQSLDLIIHPLYGIIDAIKSTEKGELARIEYFGQEKSDKIPFIGSKEVDPDYVRRAYPINRQKSPFKIV